MGRAIGGRVTGLCFLMTDTHVSCWVLLNGPVNALTNTPRLLQGGLMIDSTAAAVRSTQRMVAYYA